MGNENIYNDTIVSIKTYSKEEYIKLIEFIARFPFDTTINPEEKQIDE
tara:strand:- start:5931 stop:6074 length:144 start_codon:yes stop_codon:yes gene_type:complete